MSWGNVIAAGITAATGRRDNLEARKAAGTANSREKENATIAFERQIQLDDLARAFEREQAATAMQFSERMASTQHQREVKDLYAAGLNPILSGTGGMGAAAPSGVAGHSPSSSAPKAGTHKAQVFPSSANAISALATGAQLENMMAQTEKTKAETREIEERTPTHQENIRLTRATTEKVMADTEVSHALVGKTEAEKANIEESLNLILAQIRETHLRGEMHAQSTATGRAQERLTTASAMAGEVDARAMLNLEKAGLTEAMKAVPALAPLANVLADTIMKYLRLDKIPDFKRWGKQK